MAHVAQVWVTEMGDAGATLALDDLIRKDPPPNGFADFAAQDLAKGKDGHIYGLPWTTDTWAMVYRTDLLKEAGIERLPTTWEDIRKVSEAVYKKTGKTGFGFPAGSSASGAMWFLANFYWWSHGKELIVQKPEWLLRDRAHAGGRHGKHELLQEVHGCRRQPAAEPCRQ